MYKIIGGDKNEYGPVSADQMRQWIAQGRADANTLIQSEGATDWKPVSDFPEFADALAAKSRDFAPPPPPLSPGFTPLPEEILLRDYDFNIGSCVSRSWDLLMTRFGLVFGGAALFLVVTWGMAFLGQIPIVGILISLASFIITGPLTGGLYYFFFRVVRGQPVEVTDIFTGFRLSFVHLMLAYIISVLITGVSAIPGAIVFGVSMIPVFQGNDPTVFVVLFAILGVIIMLIPVLFLTVSWMFALPLVIDKGLDFWPALETSRRVVAKHWWKLFGLLLVTGLINLAGVAACCIGVLFTMPLAIGTMVYGYEDIFRPSAAPDSGSSDGLGMPGR